MDGEDRAELSYTRMGDRVRVRAIITGEEYRTVLLGLWAAVPVEVRQDFIDELAHYAYTPEARLPMLAVMIRDVVTGERSMGDALTYVDLIKMRHAEHDE